MPDETQTPKPLSERPLGYILAAAGGLIGAPLGIVTSPAVLFLLNKTRKGKEGKQPNRFLSWALIGIIGAPLSLVIGNPSFRNASNQGSSDTASSNSQNEKSADGAPEQPKATSIDAGDFTISSVVVEPYKGDTKGADIAGKLWAVYASVTNNSKETKVPGNNLITEVKDSEGRTFKAADFVITTNSIVNESFGGEKVTRFTDGILPGSTRKNVQVGVFDVTEGATGLKLCAGAMFSGTTCVGE